MGGRRREKEGLGKKKREGGKERGYLLSDSLAEMCWDDTSFYIRCVHSVVKPHVLSALLRYCSLLHVWVCDFMHLTLWGVHTRTCVFLCASAHQGKAFFKWVGWFFHPAEWWQCPVCCSNTELTPQASQAYSQLHIFQQPQLGLFGSPWHDRVIGLHRSLAIFDNLPHLLSELSGQAAYKSFTDLINCLKSAPLPGK